MTAERLQKVLARAGVASRRKSEELIAEGRVSINGRVVTEMGIKADPATQDVRVDGRRIRPERKVYYVLNKPRSVVCTQARGEGRRRAVDLIPETPERLYTVGRLDKESEGLIILTNDGDFANRVAHPRYEVPKTYLVDVQGKMDLSAVEQLRAGVFVEGGRARPERVHVVQRSARRSRLEVTLREGRKREVRRMLLALGFPVLRLRRTRIGPVRLGALRSGKHREMTGDEIRALLTPSARRKLRARPPQPHRKGRG